MTTTAKSSVRTSSTCDLCGQQGETVRLAFPAPAAQISQRLEACLPCLRELRRQFYQATEENGPNA